ncbi:MAG TPA: UDP-2,4-diacetamido-2,4,6-trideoxy-beta-L-altropyranose hydrolase [Microthrixaceae bacterium]|nr:UDP-2,4-diacetamido-2,4,6-trideoxy-beta-L-altropyranose hydrolase [Microthrixaceae bacterium]
MARSIPLVAIRADGSAQIGLGHVTRCLSLAEALVAQGLNVELVSGPLPKDVAAWALSVGVSTRRVTAARGGIDDAVELMRTTPDLVVVDGYGFGIDFFATLVELGCPHAVVDDNLETDASAPIMVVNQNPSADARMYGKLEERPRLLLGLDYALLRNEIRQMRPRHPEARTDPTVLVSLGGSDPSELTETIVRVLVNGGVRSVRVAVGAANPRRQILVSEIEELGAEVIDPRHFARELQSTDLAVIGAGSTMWEAAYLGIPTVAVVHASNQVAPAAAAQHLGFLCTVEGCSPDGATRVADLVHCLLADDLVRTNMSSLGRDHVDGLGADRVAAAVISILDDVA